MRPWNLSLLVALLALVVVGTTFAQYGNVTSAGNFPGVVQLNYGGAAITAAAPVTCTTGATKYSDAIKLDGCASRMTFDVTQTNASASSGTHNVTVQTSTNGATWASAAAVVAEAGPTATQVLNEVLTFTGAQSKRLTVVGVVPSNYYRLKFTAGTPAAGASNSISFSKAFCTYSYDGPAYDRRQVKVQRFKKNGVEIDATNYLSVAGGATGYTDGIRVEDCNIMGFQATMISSTSGATTHACKVQVSPDNTNWFDPVPEGTDQYVYVDLDAGWGATANTVRSWIVDGFLPAKYVRLYWTSEAAKDVTLGPLSLITY